MVKRMAIFAFFYLQLSWIAAQDDPYEIQQFPFVRYDLNRLELYECDAEFATLFNKFNKLILSGEGTINIIQIGDSHIQADYSSGRFRQRIQTFFQGGIGGRGFIFPYPMAKTNNPANYKIHYKGTWESCRNVEKDKDCNLGLSGITVTTFDSVSCISIKLKNKEYPRYDFNKLKIYHLADSTSFELEAGYPKEWKKIERNKEKGYTSIDLNQYTDSVVIHIVKNQTYQEKFELYGFSLETQDPGVIYHAIGVNGAETESYLRCQLMESHIAGLEPDMVIVSLGTNDAYPPSFKPQIFESNYDSLITKITSALPGIPLLLTVPGDCYRYRKYLNDDMYKVRNVIFDLAIKHQCAVWDFFGIMGGPNSIYLWHKNGLAGKDRLHFTKEGYIFQGDLMFNAFLKKYDEFIDEGKLEPIHQE